MNSEKNIANTVTKSKILFKLIICEATITKHILLIICACREEYEIFGNKQLGRLRSVKNIQAERRDLFMC